MNEKIREHVTKYNQSQGYAIDDDCLIETIMEGKGVYEEITGSHRWWDDVFRVVELDGMLIGFTDCHTTGDMGKYDIGWEFDPDSICEVEATQVTKTVYKPKTI